VSGARGRRSGIVQGDRPTLPRVSARAKLTLKRAVLRALRRALVGYVRGRPHAAGGGARVTILLASAWGVGGTIRTTLTVAGVLAQRHEVEILSVVRRREQPFFAFPPDVRVTALDDRRPGALRWALRPLRRALKARHSVLMTRHDALYRQASLWTDVQLVRALRRRSGVLIGTRPALNLLAGDLAVPGLVTIGWEHMHLAAHGRPLRRAIGRGYSQLGAVVVLTEHDADAYRELLPGGARLVCIPNAVRPDLGPPATGQGTTVLASGRLTRQKGLDLLLDAFARVAPRYPDWQLVICGEGHWRARLERQVAELGLRDVVDLPGAVDLPRWMDDAAVFVLSSRFEGFPLVLIEAMAKGLPVVSFDCPTGPGEIVENHRNGVLVPAGDVPALADALGALMADPALRARLGAAAAQDARRFTPDGIGARWEGLLDDLLPRPEPVRSVRAVARASSPKRLGD
jgi:glycosyltransferase involved in cell wall biosynthesis